MTAIEWMRIHNLVIGDEVEIIKADAFWMSHNPSDYKDYIGKILKISSIKTSGDKIYLCPCRIGVIWRIDCLKPVKDIQEKQEYVYKRKSLLNWKKNN